MWATSDMDLIFRARSIWSYGSVGITARMSSPKSKSRLRVRDREMKEKPGSGGSSEREREGATHPQLEENRSGDSDGESERGAARVRV